MASGSRVCPHCGRLNGAEDTICYSCKKRLPGPLGSWVGGAFGEFAADGVPGTKLIGLMCFLHYATCMASEGSLHVEVAVTGNFALSTLLRFGVLYSRLWVAEPWRLLSAVYMHLGLLHIGMNMLALVTLGRRWEERIGTARFLILYVLSGIAGFVASQWWYYDSPPTAGASGAIFGCIGALVGELFAKRDPTWSRQLVNYVVYALILNFVLQGAINTAAHLGGFSAGLVLGALFEKERRPQRLEPLMRALAGICLLASVGSVVLSARSPVWKEQRQLEQRRAEEAERLRLN